MKQSEQHPGNLFIKETYINETEHCRIGDTDFYETFTNDKRKLFKHLQKEYGKAQKMYVDLKAGGSRQIGWVFTKKVKYSDANEYYTQNVWIEVSTTQPVKECKLNNVTYPFN